MCLFKQTAGKHPLSHFSVNMIFLEDQFLGYNKIYIGFNPRGGARWPLLAPRLNGSTVNLCAIDISKAFDKVNYYPLLIQEAKLSLG